MALRARAAWGTMIVDAALGAGCLAEWIAPHDYLNVPRILVIEFVALWSGGVLFFVAAGTRSRIVRIVSLAAALPLLYGLRRAPEYGIPLVALTANRVVMLAAGGGDVTPASTIVFVRTLCLFLFSIFLTTFVPLPAFGNSWNGDTRDLWGSEPYRADACGVLYYFGLTALALVWPMSPSPTPRDQVTT